MEGRDEEMLNLFRATVNSMKVAYKETISKNSRYNAFSPRDLFWLFSKIRYFVIFLGWTRGFGTVQSGK